MYDGSDYYLFEELFLRMIGICFIHCHNEQADECLYHLSRCTEDFFLLRQESENLIICCKKGHLGWESSDGKYLATKLDSQIDVKPFFKPWWEGSWLNLQSQHFSHKILERKGLVGVNVNTSKDILLRNHENRFEKRRDIVGAVAADLPPWALHSGRPRRLCSPWTSPSTISPSNHHLCQHWHIWATTTENNLQAKLELRHKDRQHVCELGWTQGKALLLPGSGSGALSHDAEADNLFASYHSNTFPPYFF